MGERAEFEATLDMTQVNAALEKARANVYGAVGSYGDFDKAMQRTQVETSKLVGYNAEAAKSWWTLQGAGKEFQQQLGPQAAAISSISNALGQQNGAAGHAIQIAGQLAAAFAAGGPLGLAMAAAGAGVVALTNHWEELIQKQDEAITKQYLGTDNAAALLKKAEADVEDLRKRTVSSSRAAFQAVQTEIDAVDTKRHALMAKFGSAPDTTQRAELEMLDKALDVLERKQALAAAAESGGLGAATALGAGPVKMAPGFDPDAYYKAKYGVTLSEVQKDREDEMKAQHDIDVVKQRSIDDDMAARGEEFAQARKTAEMIAGLEEMKVSAKKAALDEGRALEQEALQGSVTNAIAAAQVLAEGFATGQKDAVQAATAAFLKGEGQQLVGIGTKAIFEGLAISANPLTPGAGLPMIGIGAAAIAAGVGMGAAGAAISPSTASPSKTVAATTDRGVPRSSASGGGRTSGGSITIVNNWGVGGPPAEDSARATVRLLDLADRRRMR